LNNLGTIINQNKNMTKRTFFQIALLMLVVLALTGIKSEAAVDLKGNDLEIILDCSGSMAGIVDGRSKMDIAKESLNSVVNSIPDGSYVGFRAYGHISLRSQKDCTDSELIFPIKAINKQELISKINSLQPKGWTPIEYSLNQARNDFPVTQEYGKVIILVSDGEETCGGDPCAAVKRMLNEGFQVTVNTVGFDVSDIAEQQLRCIAEATGGEYKSAKNAAELTASLKVFSSRAFEGFTTSGGAKAGTGFVNAPLVESGSYGGDILSGESKFYKFSIKKGQEITLVANIKKEQALSGGSTTYCQWMIPRLSLYDKNRFKLEENYCESIFTDSEESKAISPQGTQPASLSVSITAEKTGEYYLSITSDWYKNCEESYTNKSYGARLEAEKTEKGKALFDVTIAIEGEGVDEPLAVATTNTIDGSSATPAIDTTDNSGPKSKSKSNIIIIIGSIISLIIIISIVISGIFIFKRKKQEGEKLEEETIQNNIVATIKCPSCGTENQVGDKFCSNCGKTLF